MDEGNEAAAGDLLSSLPASSVQSRNILTYASVGTTFLVVQTTFPALKITLSRLSFGCSLVRGALGGSPLGEGSTGLFFSCALVPFP